MKKSHFGKVWASQLFGKSNKIYKTNKYIKKYQSILQKCGVGSIGQFVFKLVLCLYL